MRDVSEGLWLWRTQHPNWTPDSDFDGPVTTTCVSTGGEVIVLDPLAPPPGCTELWARIDAVPPTVAIVLKPDHVRDVDLFARRYGARAYGPGLFYPDDVPRTRLQPVDPGDQLPGGLVALYDGRGKNETPVWLPEQRTLVFSTPSPRRRATCSSGPRPPTRNALCPPCARSWIYPSSA